MVGSEGGGDTRSKEAMGVMALHEALRSVCLNSDWAYSVFWTIRPRLRSRSSNICKLGDDNGSLMLMWEDGFCRRRAADCVEGLPDGEDDPVRKVFSKMSIQLYNYGEGLMGKVASDKCHKWAFKELCENESGVSNFWQNSFDVLPPEWTDQFDSGIQTIAVIQAGNGLLQLGSCKIIPEDLHFVLRMRHMFELLGHQSGLFLSHLFSTPKSSALKQLPTTPSPPPILNWSHSSIHSASVVPPSLVYQHPSSAAAGLLGNKDDAYLFLPRSSGAQLDGATLEQDPDLRWPSGLSFFTALTGRADDAKLLFGSHEIAATKERHAQQLPLVIPGNSPSIEHCVDETEDFLNLERRSGRGRKTKHGDVCRNSALPTRMVTSSSSLLVENRGVEAGIYTDVMENLLN